jgi:hypothetical protein
VALLSGFSAVTFSFDEEPGEYRWVIRSPRLNDLDIAILFFGDLWSGLPDEQGREVFRVRCVPETFGVAVYEAAHAVLSEVGEVGYAEKWAEHPFPMQHLEELQGCLKRLGHAV